MWQSTCGLYSIQHIQNSLARAVVKAPKSCRITPILRSLLCLKITEHIEYKLLSLDYKVLTTAKPLYLYQPPRSTCYSSLVTLTRPPTSSSLQITDRSFRYASPYLCNQLPPSLRQTLHTSDFCLSASLTFTSSVLHLSYTVLVLPEAVIYIPIYLISSHRVSSCSLFVV